MSMKAPRGTKRTCQNSDCGERFYDLNRNPIACPMCQSAYVLAASPAGATAAASVEEKAPRRPAKKPEFVPVVADDVPVEVAAEEGDVPLAEVEGEEPIAAETDETFLEEEEDGGDVNTIIGGTVAEDEEET